MEPNKQGAPPSTAETFVGRTGLLDTLRPALDQVHHGGQVFVELSGEPGIGKTSVLREGLRLARRAGLATVSGACDELLTSHPYSMVTPMARHLGIRLDAVSDADVIAPLDAHRKLLSEWSSRPGPPVVIGFDNVHWADHASVELLTRLLHDPPGVPFMLVVAYRPRQEPAGLISMSPLLSPAVRHLSLSVPPMSIEEFGRMLHMESARRLEFLHAKAGGNPMYGQALAAMPERARDRLSAKGSAEVDAAHPAIRALRTEFIRLDHTTRVVVDAAAVAGEVFHPDIVTTVCPLPPEDVAAAMETLALRDLVREDPRDTTAWRFRHPVLRDLIYRELATLQRHRLHAHLADALRAQGASRVTIAHHVARSARSDDPAAVELLVASAEQLAPHSPETAIEHLESARALARDTIEPALEAKLDLNLARAYLWAGDPVAARAILQAGPPRHARTADQASFTLVRARTERLLGHHLEAQAIVRAELEAVGDDPVLEVMLAMEAAVSAAMCGSPDAVAFLDRAQQAIPGVTDEAYRIAVTIVRGFLAATWGEGPEAVENLSAAAHTVDALPDGHLVHFIDPVGLLAWGEIQLERDADALRHFDRAVTIAYRAGHVDLLPELLAGRSYVTSRLGLLAASERDAEEAVAAAQRLGAGTALGLPLNFLAAVRGYLYGPQEARPIAQEATSVMPLAAGFWPANVAQRTAVQLRHASGETFDAESALVRACGGPDLNMVEVATRPYWCAVLAEMSLSAGQVEAAKGWIEKGLGFTRDHLPGATAHVWLAEARFDAVHNDVRSSRVKATAAADTFHRLGWASGEFGARMFIAELCHRLSDWDAMFAALAEARGLADTTGSSWFRRAVIAQQRRLGSAAGVNAAGQPRSFAELSRRELEIARLAAGGVTNNEIATKLHVTVKTVEAHLSRSYRKLGVRSRTMLAAVLTALPLTVDERLPPP